MQKFDENTIEFQYIQNLLFSTYIPTIDYYEDDSYVPTPEEGTVTYISGNSIKTKDSNETVRTISAYESGKFYPNITTNYVNKKNYYNSDLHEKLGDYLRWYNKTSNINLMPFYNCFSNRYIDEFSLPIIKKDYTKGNENEEKTVVTGSPYNANKKLFAFPVRLGCSYTIAMQSDSSEGDVKCQLALYNGERLLSCKHGDTYYVFPRQQIFTSFEDPHQYNVDPEIVPKSLERYLYMFIEISVLNNTSIVILERKGKNDICLNPSLLVKNNYTQYAFADKLMEFLLGNVIIPGYEINESVAEYQDIMKTAKFEETYGRKLENCIKGTFDTGPNSMHFFIYHTFSNMEVQYDGSLMKELIRDFTGYIDKDVEQFILAAKKEK